MYILMNMPNNQYFIVSLDRCGAVMGTPGCRRAAAKSDQDETIERAAPMFSIIDAALTSDAEAHRAPMIILYISKLLYI